MYQVLTDSAAPKAPAQTPEGAQPILPMAIAALRRRKFLLCATTFAFTLAALILALLIPPRFVATAQLVIDPNELRAVENVLRVPNQFNDSHIAQIESQVRVLVSDNVIRRVVDSQKLAGDVEFVGPAPSGLAEVGAFVRRLLGVSASERQDVLLEAMQTLRKRVSSKRIERTYVVEIGVWTRDPEKSVRLASALVDAFLAEQASAREEAARRVSTSLSTRLGELQKRVQEAEQRVQDYKRANGILRTGGQLVNEQQLTELSTQLVSARTRTSELKARYEQIKGLHARNQDPGAVRDAIESVTIASLRSQLGEIVQRDGELTTTLGDRHPAVAANRSQATHLRHLIREEVGRIADSAGNDLVRALASEEALAQRLADMKLSLESTNESSVRLRELERDLVASRTVYEAFMVRTREIMEQERLDTSNVRVISPPQQPEHRSWPPRTLFVMIAGLLAGLGCGIACVLFEARIRPNSRLDPGSKSPGAEQPAAIIGAFAKPAAPKLSAITDRMLAKRSPRGAKA